jgi:bifunctional DNase/RNase
MPDLVEVVIDTIRVSLMSPQRIVMLREKNTDRYLPIWVGLNEAEAITIALQEVEVIRPLTHDLLKNLFTIFNALLVRVEIQSIKEDIYYGNIVAELDGKTINIDSRSSDAIALAVRAHIPIMVFASVMDTASIHPEPDLQQDIHLEPFEKSDPEVGAGLVPAQEPPPVASAADQERLSIFDDFLDKLDPTLPRPPAEGDQPDPDKSS